MRKEKELHRQSGQTEVRERGDSKPYYAAVSLLVLDQEHISHFF